MIAPDEPILVDDGPLPPPAPRLTASGTRARVDLKLDPKLVARIDKARGGATRTAWIERACRERLEPKKRAAPTPPPERITGPSPTPPVPNAVADCPHPGTLRQHYAWGSICGLCGAKV